jgi:hypothetical protein
MAKVSDWHQFVDVAVYDAILLLLDTNPKQEEMSKVGRVLLHLNLQDPNLSSAGILPQSSPPLLAQLNLELLSEHCKLLPSAWLWSMLVKGLHFWEEITGRPQEHHLMKSYAMHDPSEINCM